MKRFKLTGLLSSAFILILLLFSAVINQLTAQNAVSLDNKLANLEPTEAQHLKSLTVDLYPSVFLEQGQITVYETDPPVVAFFDAPSIGLLYENNPLFNEVEILRIKIDNQNEIPSSLNIDQLQSFDNLKYIYFLFTYDACGNQSDACLASIVDNIITETNSRSSGAMRTAQFPASLIFNLSILE